MHDLHVADRAGGQQTKFAKWGGGVIDAQAWSLYNQGSLCFLCQRPSNIDGPQSASGTRTLNF